MIFVQRASYHFSNSSLCVAVIRAIRTFVFVNALVPVPPVAGALTNTFSALAVCIGWAVFAWLVFVTYKSIPLEAGVANAF